MLAWHLRTLITVGDRIPACNPAEIRELSPGYQQRDREARKDIERRLMERAREMHRELVMIRSPC